MTKKAITCYRCNNTPTSKEHIPPKCLFPETKDFENQNFRKNLLKVPSCDIHNLKKTKDDEFLMICMAGSINVNQIGYVHFNSKVIRALIRKHSSFLNEICKNYQENFLTTSKGNTIPALKGGVNINRLNNCFKSIIYGLYYLHFNSVFDGEIKIVNNFILFENENQRSFYKLCNSAYKRDPKLTGVLGDNPEVFNYQITKKDNYGTSSMKLIFYEGIEIIAALIPKDFEKPFVLELGLLNSGMNITFQMPDGDIHFEKENE